MTDRTRESRRCRFGFTLVELLVVIGIISLLVAILLPSLRRARQSGERIRCMSNERQLVQALMMYVGENKGYFPIAPRVYYTPDLYSFTYDSGGWIPMIARYTGQEPDWTTYAGYTVSKRSVFFCPIPAQGLYAAGYDYHWTYAMNHDLRTERRITNVQFPLSGVFAFVEAGFNGDLLNWGYLSDGFFGSDFAPDNAGPAHNGEGTPIAYLDGHAEWYSAPRSRDEFLIIDSRRPWLHTRFWGFRPEMATTFFAGLGGTAQCYFNP